MLIGSKITSGSSIPLLIGWKVTSFPRYLCRFAITTNFAERCKLVLGRKIWPKNIVEDINKRISSSTGEILAIPPRAPSFPIPRSWNRTPAVFSTAFDSSCLIFACRVICRLGCCAWYIRCPFIHFTNNNRIKFSGFAAPNQDSGVEQAVAAVLTTALNPCHFFLSVHYLACPHLFTTIDN